MTKEDNDELIFFAEEEEVEDPFLEPWKILIVDDEEEVHRMTKMVLSDVVFEERELEFTSVFSGAEAKQIFEGEDNFALVLLDVVMEEDDSGLQVVKYVRNELYNSKTRIILRTGQPGQAPEDKVILEYDINDYKAKTELTSQKLFTAVISSLRAYRDILIIERSKEGLEKILEASSNIFRFKSLQNFTSGVLTQLLSFFSYRYSGFYGKTSGFSATHKNGEFYILAGAGDYADKVNQQVRDALPPFIVEELQNALEEKNYLFIGENYFGYLLESNHHEHLLFIEGVRYLKPSDQRLIEIFCKNAVVAFDRLQHSVDARKSQREILYTLSRVMERRENISSQHINRIAEYTRFLARKVGLDEEESEIASLASCLHDVGNLAISDSILKKKGELTNEEYEVVKKHAKLGYEFLNQSDSEIFKAAAIIAYHHQEKYDGSGYPCGLKDDEIHIYGRIVAVADVFDAITCERTQKKAWDYKSLTEYFMKERGKHFDPNLVDILIQNLNYFIKVREQFPE